jgi:hypothetical protein
MTLPTSTRTHTQHRDTRPPRRPGSVRLQALGVGVALAVALGAMALSGQSTYESEDGDHTTYARPTAALHGQPLAVYLAAHQSGRLARQR